jgi:hypothetical protein
MKLWLRLPLAAALLVAGGGLLFWSVAAILSALSNTGGLRIVHLFAAVGALSCIGASVDLLRGRRASAPRQPLAESEDADRRRPVDAPQMRGGGVPASLDNVIV